MRKFINLLRSLVGLPPRCPLRFFWIGEESEIYVARSLEEALEAFAQPEDLEERQYGELNPYNRVTAYDEETGRCRSATLAELGAECLMIPNVVLTQYA